MKVNYEKAIKVHNELKLNVQEQQDYKKNIQKSHVTYTMIMKFRKSQLL